MDNATRKLMRSVFAIAAVLGLAGPAHATGGISCMPTKGAGPAINIVTGHMGVSRVVSVAVKERGKVITARQEGGPDDQNIVVGQSWIDEKVVWIDLVNLRNSKFEGKLRATFGTGRKRGVATGTFVRRGRTFFVSCIGE